MQGKSKKKIIILSCVSVFVILLIFYLSASVFFQYHFLSGTTINGIDCSYKSIDDVNDLLEDEIRTYYLRIIERNNTEERISAQDIELEIAIKGDLDVIKESQNQYLWLFGSDKEYTVETYISYNEALLESKVNFLNCIDPDKIVEPTAPVISYDGTTYIITRAEAGTRVDSEKLKGMILDAVKDLEKEFNIEESGCYTDSLISDSNVYDGLISKLNSYVNTKITLIFGDSTEDEDTTEYSHQEVIDSKKISNWLSVDENLEIQFDKEAIEEYVETLAKDYETMGQTRKFINSYGVETTIRGGDYGWWIATGAEVDEIINNIKEAKDVTRELNYLQKAVSYGEDNDFGDTYIEVCLSKQRLFCYSKGELITECDIISGKNLSEYETPTGVYRMRFMMKNYKFNRSYFDKTVAYWMVFYGNSVETNIGVVSCDWRTDFGGISYKTNGSYGSIYTPLENAKIIYDNIPNDIPVIIYK